MFKGKLCYYIVLGILMTLFSAKCVFAQHRIQHQAPTVAERGSTIELTFEAPGINPDDIQDVFLFYRVDGSIAYEQERMEVEPSAFGISFDIPPGNASSLEYYLEVQFNDGRVQTYPPNGAAGNPVRVEIVENRQTDQPETGSSGEIEYTILSPEQGEDVRPEDVVIAITLFYDEGAVDTATSAFQLLLDGEDITGKANASPYFLTYVPDKLAEGQHMVSLQIKTEDTTEEIVAWDFTVTDAATPLALGMDGEMISDSWAPAGEMELTARNQMIAGNTNDALSGNIRLNGQKGNIRYSAYGLLTSQEDPRLQPQNRYGAELYIEDWFELQAGHIYPVLSPLTIAGQRVQGISAAFHPFNHAINMQFVYGKLRRGISNRYSQVQVQPLSINDVVVDTGYVLDIPDGGYGTFRREIIGGRLDFRRGQKFNLGFNLLKIQDDTNSIDLISNYRELINRHPDMAQNLSQEDRNKLEAEPDLLSVNGNPLPKGNFVAGTDLMADLLDNHIQFRADGAVSLLNEDISGGILTGERARELGFELESGVEHMLDRLSWLIIINENISPLPLRFKVNGEETSAEAFFPASVVAAQSELSFNYFKNNLRLQYRWVGPYFNSLANSTVRKDLAGYTISDRFRLFDNRMYVTLGYENLKDNVVSNRDATTNTATFRGNVSWYPISSELPRVSVGLMSRNRENGVDFFNPYITPSLKNAAVRNYEVREDTVIAPNIRLSNTLQFTTSVSQQFQFLGLTHDASLNYSLLNTRDDFFAYGDAKSHSLSFYLTNRFRELPLDTNVGFSINSTQTGSGLTDIDIFGFNLGGSIFLLDNQLTVDAALAFTRNKVESTPLTVGDNGTPGDNSDDYYEPDVLARSDSHSNSYIFSAGARYSINQNHAFVVNMRFANVTSPLDGIQTPDDRIVQARYIFSF